MSYLKFVFVINKVLKFNFIGVYKTQEFIRYIKVDNQIYSLSIINFGIRTYQLLVFMKG